jgi:hypothetical protein
MAFDMTGAHVAITDAGRQSRFEAHLERADFRSRLMHEGSLLFLAVAVLALSFGMPALQSRHMWLSIPCLFKAITHLPCLACGLTRSFVQTAHGHLTAAFEFHLLGPLLFGLTAISAIYLAVAVASGYRVRVAFAPGTRRIAAWSVLALFVVCWIIKLSVMRGGW